MTAEEKKQALDKAREFFVKDRFAMVVTGIEIADLEHCYAKCSLKLTEKHLNAADSVMGGAIYTLADFTFAVASNWEDEKTVTVSSTISYLGRAKGEYLISESKLIKNGRTTCTYEIHISDEKNNPVAVVLTTGMKVA